MQTIKLDDSMKHSHSNKKVLDKIVSPIYEIGDVIEFENVVVNGFLTSGGSNIQLLLPLNKPIADDVTSVTASNLKMSFRNNGIYLIGGNDGVNVPSTGITLNFVSKRKPGHLAMSLTLSSVASGYMNNAPVSSMVITGKFTLH